MIFFLKKGIRAYIEFLIPPFFSWQRDKVKELTTGIGDTRTGISDVKTFIDGMRGSRDQKVQDLNNLKARLREQNERLLKVTQEKAQVRIQQRTL